MTERKGKRVSGDDPNSIEPRHHVIKRWSVWCTFAHRWVMADWGCPDALTKTAATAYARKNPHWIIVPIEVHVPRQYAPKRSSKRSHP